MPEEAGRIVKRKRIRLPSGRTVDIPVIAQITFLDPVNRAQETEHTVDNTEAADRDVHIALVRGDGTTDETGGSGSGLRVERIETWRVLDLVQQAQESNFAIDNKTVQQPPDAPPYFNNHTKTHIVKYINTPDDGSFIKSELIDEFSFIDPIERYQESAYALNNPPDNTDIDGLTLGTDANGDPTVAIDPGIDEIADGNGVPDPIRTDPFQNIVDFNDEVHTDIVFVWVYIGTFQDWYFDASAFSHRLSISNFKFTRTSSLGFLERYFPYTGNSLPVNTDFPISTTHWNADFYPNPAAHFGEWVWVGPDVPGNPDFAQDDPNAPGYLVMVESDPAIANIKTDFGDGPPQPL